VKNIKIISATTARNKWFELINWINTEKKEVWIKRRNKIVLKIYPSYSSSFEDTAAILEKTRGILKNKKTFFPYQDDKKVIEREKKYLKKIRKWQIR